MNVQFFDFEEPDEEEIVPSRSPDESRISTLEPTAASIGTIHCLYLNTKNIIFLQNNVYFIQFI